MKKLDIRKTSLIFTLLTISSCAPGQLLENLRLPILQMPGSQSQFVYHKVDNRYETLSQLALYYTGDSSNWRTILQYNPGITPNRLQLGSTVKIPMAMINFENRQPNYPRVTKNQKRQDDTRVARQSGTKNKPKNQEPPKNNPDDSLLLGGDEAKLPITSTDGSTPAPRILGDAAPETATTDKEIIKDELPAAIPANNPTENSGNKTKSDDELLE